MSNFRDSSRKAFLFLRRYVAKYQEPTVRLVRPTAITTKTQIYPETTAFPLAESQLKRLVEKTDWIFWLVIALLGFLGTMALTATVDNGRNTIVNNAIDLIWELSRFMSCESSVLVLASWVFTLERWRFSLLSSLAKWFQAYPIVRLERDLGVLETIAQLTVCIVSDMLSITILQSLILSSYSLEISLSRRLIRSPACLNLLWVFETAGDRPFEWFGHIDFPNLAVFVTILADCLLAAFIWFMRSRLS